MSDRIKLAEAMGWESYQDCVTGATMVWLPPGEDADDPEAYRETPPNPEHDANDDYAILEKMREQGPERWEQFKAYFINTRCDWNIWNYEKGLFARAALKVIP